MDNLNWFFDEIEKRRLNYPYDLIRIMEILNDYWLTEPDEEEVKVLMKFRHHDGQEQIKELIWKNPKYAKPTDPGKIMFRTALEILSEPCRCEWCGQALRGYKSGRGEQ